MGLPVENCVVLVQGLGLGGGTLAPGVLFFVPAFFFLFFRQHLRRFTLSSSLVGTFLQVIWCYLVENYGR